MEDIFVLKNVVSSITAVAALNTIAAGELVVLGDGKVILDGTAGQAQDIKRVQFIVKKDDGTVHTSVPILRRSVDYVNWQYYRAPVNGVFVIPYASITDSTVGEFDFTIMNKSHNHTINTERRNVNLTKKSTETTAQFLARVVVKLNNPYPSGQVPNWYVASTSTTNLTITLSNPHVDLAIGTRGIAAGVTGTYTTAPVPGIGVGTDVQAMEKDYTRYKGNDGVIENSDLWFNYNPDAVGSGTYSIATIGFTSENDSPTVKRFSARNTIAIAYPSAATALQTRLAAILAQVFGLGWSGTDNAEPGSNVPDTSEVDGATTTGAA